MNEVKQRNLLIKAQRGISLIEVSLYIIVFSISIITASESIRSQLKLKETEEVINSIRQFNHAIIQYTIDNQVKLLSSENVTVLSFDDLKRNEYLSTKTMNNNFLSFASTGYVFKKNVSNVKVDVSRPQILGIIMTCPKKNIHIPPYLLRYISNKLGSSAGLMDVNRSHIIGSHGLWSIQQQDSVPTIPLFVKGNEQCIYSLISDVSFFHQKGATQPPAFKQENIIVEASSAGRESQLLEGDVWRPLFTTDTIHLVNKNMSKHVRVDIEDEKNKIIYSDFFNDTNIFIKPIDLSFGKNPASIFGRAFKIKITTFDDLQHQGDSFYLLNNSKVTIDRYQSSILKKFTIKIGVNLYNNNYKVPSQAVPPTRSDIGYCADEEKTTVITPMGVDIVGMTIVPIASEQKAVSYIEPQEIMIYVDNSATQDALSSKDKEELPKYDINTGIKRIFTLKINSPSDLQTESIFWDSFDLRFTQSPFIGKATLTDPLFYLITPACQTVMKGVATIYFSINNETKKIGGSIKWDAGNKLSWGFHDVSIY